MALEHLAWPYRAGVVVYQDTDAERKAAAAVLAATPRGAIVELPTFGVDTPLFAQRPVDAERVASQINEFDPRLAATATELINLREAAVSNVRVAVKSEG